MYPFDAVLLADLVKAFEWLSPQWIMAIIEARRAPHEGVRQATMQIKNSSATLNSSISLRSFALYKARSDVLF